MGSFRSNEVGVREVLDYLDGGEIPSESLSVKTENRRDPVVTLTIPLVDFFRQRCYVHLLKMSCNH